MMNIKFVLLRDVTGKDFTLGRFFCDGSLLGYTCEDKDRKLEEGGQKIAGQTAIPRGLYHLTATMSNRFGRMMPLIQNVPQFDGIRVHGGNRAEDSLGCPLLGAIRTANGVSKCAEVNNKLLEFIMNAEEAGDECWIEVQ